MPGIHDVAVEFAAFTNTLSTERQELIESISALNNGFEGWLKFELYFWLIKNRQLRGSEDVGMEYKVALDQRYAVMDRQTKQCDLWVRDGGNQGYHFVELKAPFANTNQGKMMQSAADDFWYMSRLKGSSENVVSGSAVILGVGFSADSWKLHIDHLVAYSGMPADCITTNYGLLGDSGGLRWAVVTTWY